jgi:glutathione synthase/RimK-type ligase-like ATP-grasp enzyme
MEWDNLSTICEVLDRQGVPIPDTWLTREPPSRTWKRAFENYPDVVTKVIAYRSKAAVPQA